MMSVRVDTVTGKAGDTMTVNVYYTFAGESPFDLHAFNAKFDYDTNLAYIAGYITAGTASEPLSIYDQTHLGIVFLSSRGTDIDFTKSVLFRMRIVLRQSLSDTAWIRWVAFGTDEAVDSVNMQDGWVRTPTTTAHTLISAQREVVSGVSSGYFADSVRFRWPVLISDVSGANIKSAELQFVYDYRHLAFIGATSTSQTSKVTALHDNGTAVKIDFESAGPKMLGADTLVNLDFYALVGIDTVCTKLDSVRWTPLNADAKIGVTDVAFDSVCLYGKLRIANVEQQVRRPSILSESREGLRGHDRI